MNEVITVFSLLMYKLDEIEIGKKKNCQEIKCIYTNCRYKLLMSGDQGCN